MHWQIHCTVAKKCDLKKDFELQTAAEMTLDNNDYLIRKALDAPLRHPPTNQDSSCRDARKRRQTVTKKRELQSQISTIESSMDQTRSSVRTKCWSDRHGLLLANCPTWYPPDFRFESRMFTCAKWCDNRMKTASVRVNSITRCARKITSAQLIARVLFSYLQLNKFIFKVIQVSSNCKCFGLIVS